MILNGEMALVLRFKPNLIVSGVHCVKVVDKVITTDNSCKLLHMPSESAIGMDYGTTSDCCSKRGFRKYFFTNNNFVGYRGIN